MADSTLNDFVSSGTAAEMAGFTPSPPTPASGNDPGYTFFNTDDGILYSWDGANWVSGGGGSGSVTNTGTLTDHALIVGNAGVDVTALASLGTSTTLLHGAAAGDPTWGAVVEADITLANNATNDVSITKHGFAPIAPNDATKYLDGTGAYSVPASGGDWTQLDEIITAASQATVDFTSISGSYRSLVVVFASQDTQAGTGSVVMRVRLNNDSTSGNYTSTTYVGVQNAGNVATTFAAAAGGVFVAGNPQSGNTGISNATALWLINYARTTFHKRVNSYCTYEDGTTAVSAFTLTARWKSTAAITRVTFTTDGTAFTDGSVFTLYGIG